MPWMVEHAFNILRAGLPCTTASVELSHNNHDVAMDTIYSIDVIIVGYLMFPVQQPSVLLVTFKPVSAAQPTSYISALKDGALRGRW